MPDPNLSPPPLAACRLDPQSDADPSCVAPGCAQAARATAGGRPYCREHAPCGCARCANLRDLDREYRLILAPDAREVTPW